jgi:hypothetical protein
MKPEQILPSGIVLCSSGGRPGYLAAATIIPVINAVQSWGLKSLRENLVLYQGTTLVVP